MDDPDLSDEQFERRTDGFTDATDAALFSLAGTQVCQEGGRIRIFTGLNTPVDCTDRPVNQNGVDQ